MLRSGKRYPSKIVHVSAVFLTVLLRAPLAPNPGPQPGVLRQSFCGRYAAVNGRAFSRSL